ncbi:TetR/AcrR family transcriptional regulator [Fulvivirgaceae bacterium BMA10]|uniref:TetR/AcrR family transcriptional regulator n=1 Tax=Splendidivirga corallicola TaxID=3051826 RepID=A0ABT8KID9_9BACT|nr:TetR/AcrR family transcriptional regulator [Fulvivirgaceae bacterium BMA10]
MSPKSKEQFAALRKKSKEKILMAALEVFAEKGYHASSVEGVAKRANISKGLIYNYFSSKEALLKELLNVLMHEGSEMIRKMDLDKSNEAFGYFMNTFKKSLVEKRKFWKLNASLALQEEVGRFDFVKEIVQNQIQGYLKLMEHILEKRGFENPKMEAMLLGSILDGISFQYVVVGESYPLDKVVDHVIAKYSAKNEPD